MGRPVKKWKKEFRCNGMEKAKAIMDALEWPISPKLYDRQKINEETADKAAEQKKVCKRIETWTSKLVMD